MGACDSNEKAKIKKNNDVSDLDNGEKYNKYNNGIYSGFKSNNDNFGTDEGIKFKNYNSLYDGLQYNYNSSLGIGIKYNDSKVNKKYKNYKCPNGHPLVWQGEKYIYKSELNCDNCRKNSELNHPIRWKCLECNSLFCTLCYENIIDEFCPVGHRFEFGKTNLSSFTCDNCYDSFSANDCKFYDHTCNITYCSKCFLDALNVR